MLVHYIEDMLADRGIIVCDSETLAYPGYIGSPIDGQAFSVSMTYCTVMM